MRRFATGLFAGVFLCSAACLGPKGENGLRADITQVLGMDDTRIDALTKEGVIAA